MTDRDDLRNPYDDFAAAKEEPEVPKTPVLLYIILAVVLVALIVGMVDMLGGGM